MIGFDTLPLVEFVPSPHISHKRVIECLRMDPSEESGRFAGLKPAKKVGRGQDGWQENGNPHGDE